MIHLTNTIRKLEIDLTASSSVALPVIVGFRDMRLLDGATGPGSVLSTSNGTSDVTICSAPPSGVSRLIETVTIQNPCDNSVTVRVYYDESGTEYNILKVTLAAGDTLMYEDE